MKPKILNLLFYSPIHEQTNSSNSNFLKKILLNVLQYTLFLGLGIVLLYFAFRSIDVNVLVDRLKHTNYWLISLSLLFGFAGMFARSYRWDIMIEPLGFKPGIINTYHALLIGYTANYAFPRIGEITRCGVLNRTDNIPADRLIGTVVAERICDMITLLFLTILVIFIELDIFGKFFNDKILQPLISKFGWLLDLSFYTWLLIGFILLLAFFLIYAYRETIKKVVFIRKIGVAGKGILNGVHSIFYIKRKIGFFFSTAIIWVLYLAMTYFALKAMTPTAHLNLVDALFILIAGSYGFVAPVQAGIGAYHGLVALGLSIFAVSWSDGLAYALLSHGSQAISIILLGIISMLILFFRKKKEKT
jgi:glycosyltransferase 2 family protein